MHCQISLNMHHGKKQFSISNRGLLLTLGGSTKSYKASNAVHEVLVDRVSVQYHCRLGGHLEVLVYILAPTKGTEVDCMPLFPHCDSHTVWNSCCKKIHSLEVLLSSPWTSNCWPCTSTVHVLVHAGWREGDSIISMSSTGQLCSFMLTTHHLMLGGALPERCRVQDRSYLHV